MMISEEDLELRHGYRKSDVLLKLGLVVEALECHVKGDCFVTGGSIIEYPIEYALAELHELRYHIGEPTTGKPIGEPTTGKPVSIEPDELENWQEKCSTCPIVDSCFLKNCVNYCSGVIDVSPLIEMIQSDLEEIESKVIENIIDNTWVPKTYRAIFKRYLEWKEGQTS